MLDTIFPGTCFARAVRILSLSLVVCSFPAISDEHLSGPVIYGDKDLKQVVFRDKAVLRKLLNDIYIPFNAVIPAMGISAKELEQAKQLAALTKQKIKEDNAQPGIDKNGPDRFFRSIVKDWATRIEVLANTPGRTDIDAGRNFAEAEAFREAGELTRAVAAYNAAALMGSTQALQELVNILLADAGIAALDNLDFKGLDLLATLRPKGTLQIMRNFLGVYKREVNQFTSGQIKYLPWVNITYATVYLMAYGNEADRLLLAGLPLSKNILVVALFWAATVNAGNLFFDQFQDSFYQKIFRFGMYCASFLYRSEDEVGRLIANYVQLQVQAAFKPEDINSYTLYFADLYNEKQLSRCRLSSRLLSGIWEVHEDEHSAYLKWVKQDGVYEQISPVLKSLRDNDSLKPNQIDYSLLDYSLKLNQVNYLESALNNEMPSWFDGSDTPLYLQLLSTYLKVTEDTHRVTDLFRSGMDRGERRAVYRVVNFDNPDIAIASIVTVLPRVKGKTLQIGIQLDSTFGIGSSSGLSVMIGGDDKKIAAYLENSSLSLIDKVVLEREYKQVVLKFLRTTSGGTHIFEIPVNVDNPLQGLLSVQMKAFEEDWQLNFPLATTQYAIRYRLRTVSQESSP